MIPRTFSASSLKTAQQCLSSYKASYIDKASTVSSFPGMVGSAVHGCLERYVKAVYINKTHEPGLPLLVFFYNESYQEVWQSANYDTLEYSDGLGLSRKWLDRTDLSNTEILSCEVKENFPVNTPVGPIPFTYIWDRCDRLEEGVYRVVDYKTERAYLTASALRERIQARAYGLAAQIKYPDATRIWVQFDMLRHDSPLATVFTREDNIQTWIMLKEECKRVIETPEENPPETINPGCRYCVRIATCETLRSNVDAGGIFGLTISEAASLRSEVADKITGLTELDKQLDDILVNHGEKIDEVEYIVDGYKVELGGTAKRAANSLEIARIVGPELTQRYGKFNVSAVDDMLKKEALPDKTIAAIKLLMPKTVSTIHAKVKKYEDNPIFGEETA